MSEVITGALCARMALTTLPQETGKNSTIQEAIHLLFALLFSQIEAIIASLDKEESKFVQGAQDEEQGEADLRVSIDIILADVASSNAAQDEEQEEADLRRAIEASMAEVASSNAAQQEKRCRCVIM